MASHIDDDDDDCCYIEVMMKASSRGRAVPEFVCLRAGMRGSNAGGSARSWCGSEAQAVAAVSLPPAARCVLAIGERD